MRNLDFPRVKLAQLPTPLEGMPRLSAALGGSSLHVKRDDQTGLAFGGNKTRKLELLAGAAMAEGARTLVTRGAAQSNHCRQTAAAAAKLGLGCILVLRGTAPELANGNLFLDRLLGAELVWTENRDPDLVLAECCVRASKAGRKPYAIPYGGSSALGAAAYVLAFEELLEQDAGFGTIVVASSSGGTQAGLVAGAKLHGWSGRILGISIEPRAEELCRTVAGIATEMFGLMGRTEAVAPEHVEVLDGYLGAGYGVPGELECGAISLMARTEGLLVDPVYTGRAAGAMIDLIRRGQIGAEERVLFWHTGGGPALFAHAPQLS